MDNRKFRGNASATPPAVEAAPSVGYPVDGNPGGGIQATIPGASWFHQIGEEVRNVITAGGLTPSDASVNQMVTAIQQLITNNGAIKIPVRTIVTTNIASLAGGAPNTNDGVTLAANDRLLLAGQTTASQNGWYVVQTLGTGANGTWVRATDADGVGEVVAGVLTAVAEGTTNADTIWELTTDGTIVVGATALNFARKDAGASATVAAGLVDGGCLYAQGAVANLSTSPQYGTIDMCSAWASGGTVGAGTITNDTAAPIGLTGKAMRLSGVTLTGSGQTSERRRMESANAVKWKNKTASFQVNVQHDCGAGVNHVLVVRKATALDNFTSTTVIATSSAVSVPTATGTVLKFENVALGDCTNGLEIELQRVCGAITTKNFWATEWQIDEGSIAKPYVHQDEALVFSQVRRHVQKTYDPTVAPGTNTSTGAFQVSGNVQAATSCQAFNIFFREQMRGTPSMSFWLENGTSGQINIANFAVASSNVAPSLQRSGRAGVSLAATVAGFTGGQACHATGHYFADARLAP